MYKHTGMLETFQCGACWPKERKFQAGLTDNPYCDRCEGGIVEDMPHLLYHCPANLKVQGIAQTNYLCSIAPCDFKEYPCLFERGLIPKNLTKPTTPFPVSSKLVLVGNHGF